MKRLVLALAFATAFAATPAAADFSIIRWSWGDCKIWHNSDFLPAPLGGGWMTLVNDLPTYDIAWRALQEMYRQGECR